MKKVLVIILTCILAISLLSACAGGKPDGMSLRVYNYASSALKVMKKYNKRQVNASIAYDKLESIYDQIEEYQESVDEKKDEIDVTDDKWPDLAIESMQCGLIMIYINNFRVGIANDELDDYDSQYNTYDIEADLEEYLNNTE